MSRHRELTGEHLDFWTERHLCSVVTLGADGSPHVVPMGFAVEPEAGRAWAITSRGTQKVVNLQRDPRIAISQVEGRRWSTLTGTAEVLEDPASVAEAERRYAERYQAPRENPRRVALRVTLTGVIGNV